MPGTSITVCVIEIEVYLPYCFERLVLADLLDNFLFEDCLNSVILNQIIELSVDMIPNVGMFFAFAVRCVCRSG